MLISQSMLAKANSVDDEEIWDIICIIIRVSEISLQSIVIL